MHCIDLTNRSFESTSSAQKMQKGHSTTTWTKVYRILTTYLPRVDKHGHFTYSLDIGDCFKFCGLLRKPELCFVKWPPPHGLLYQPTTYPPLLIHVVFECPQSVCTVVMSPSRAGSSHSSSWSIFSWAQLGSAQLVTFLLQLGLIFFQLANQKIAIFCCPEKKIWS